MVNIFLFISHIIQEVIGAVYSCRILTPKHGHKDMLRVILIRFFIPFVIIKTSYPVHTLLRTIFAIAILYYFYADSYKRRALFMAVEVFVNIAVEIIGMSMMKYMFNFTLPDFLSYNFICFFFSLLSIVNLLILLEIFVIADKKCTPIKLLGSDYLVISLLLFVYSAILCAMTIVFTHFGMFDMSISAFAVVQLALAALSLIFIVIHMRVQRKKLIEEQFLERQIELQTAHNNEMRKQYDYLNGVHHDFANHLQTIYSLSDSSNEKLRAYIEDIAAAFDKPHSVTFCSNPTVDAVLFNKKEYAESLGIKIDISADIPESCEISNVDLCSLIYNLLDNAIEGCQRESENKYIQFAIFEKKSYYVIRCANGCTSYIEASRKQNDKINHGWGMKIISKLAAKYRGSDIVRFENNEFLHIVTIPSSSVCGKGSV